MTNQPRATTEQAEAGAMLPELPTPAMHEVNPYLHQPIDPHNGKRCLTWFTAGQMRAYAQAAIDALTRKGGEAVAVVGKDGYPHWLASWLTSESYRTLETGTKLYTEPTRAQERKDTARLNFIERTFGGCSNQERYLQLRMLWGKGANGRTLREACDKYMARDIAAAPRDGDNIKHNEEK